MLLGCRPLLSESISFRLEAIAFRMEPIAFRLEAHRYQFVIWFCFFESCETRCQTIHKQIFVRENRHFCNENGLFSSVKVRVWALLCVVV